MISMKGTELNMHKLLSWQDVIDMYGEQELQKIKEEKEMKEKAYYQTRSKERLKQPILPISVVGPSDPTQTSVKEFESTQPPTSYVPRIHTETRTVSSSGTVTTPTTLRSQSEVPGSLSIARQRELSQQEALETAAQFHRTLGSEIPRPREGQDAPVSESVVPSVPRDVEQMDSLQEQGERSIPVGSVPLTQSSMILAGHPDVMYQNIFPSEMSISNQDAALRLDPEENWRLLYPFTEPGVRRVEAGAPASMARLAHSDSLVETIQIQIYLEDIPEWGQCDFRRYPARFGDPNYVYQPCANGTPRDRSERSRD